jgi:hypothetical protein
MPHKVEIVLASRWPQRVDAELLNGYLAFAFPGKYLGYGVTMEEALTMACLRLRNQKDKYLEDHSEREWHTFANERAAKIDIAHDKFGIKSESTWNIENVDQTTQNGE